MVDGDCVPDQICDEEQCLIQDICPANSQCNEKCNMYECICDSGFSMEGLDH